MPELKWSLFRHRVYQRQENGTDLGEDVLSCGSPRREGHHGDSWWARAAAVTGLRYRRWHRLDALARPPCSPGEEPAEHPASAELSQCLDLKGLFQPKVAVRTVSCSRSSFASCCYWMLIAFSSLITLFSAAPLFNLTIISSEENRPMRDLRGFVYELGHLLLPVQIRRNLN